MTRTAQTPAGKRVLRRPAISVSIAVSTAAAVTLCAGCTPETNGEASYTPKPRPPWSSDEYASTRLILERSDGGFELVSSTPSFGGVTRPDVAEAMPAILEGKQRLYEYAARNRDGAIVAQGYFLVPLTARATFTEADDAGRIHHVEVEDPSPIVRVAIPFVPELAAVEFRAMVPDRSRNYQTWARESVGSIRVEAPVRQRPEGESS